MTIAQALKEKNKKVDKIRKIWERIASYNSVIEGAEQPYDMDKLWDEYNSEIAALIDLKTSIHQASAPVRKDIFALSEIKSKVQSLRSLNTSSGKHRARFAEEITETVAHFNMIWKDSQIESLEKMIEGIQEKLDAFNHSTNI